MSNFNPDRYTSRDFTEQTSVNLAPGIFGNFGPGVRMFTRNGSNSTPTTKNPVKQTSSENNKNEDIEPYEDSMFDDGYL